MNKANQTEKAVNLRAYDDSTKWGFGIEQSMVVIDGDKGCIPIHPELHISKAAKAQRTEENVSGA